MSTPYSLSGTPSEMKTRSVINRDNWLIAFVERDLSDDIKNVEKNIEFNFDGTRRIEFTYHMNKLCLVGRNDVLDDFNQEILNSIRIKHTKLPLGTKIAVVFDCKDFTKPEYFDRIVLSANKESYVQYFCVNSWQGAKGAIENVSECQYKSCSICESVPSSCSHSCFYRLKELI